MTSKPHPTPTPHPRKTLPDPVAVNRGTGRYAVPIVLRPTGREVPAPPLPPEEPADVADPMTDAMPPAPVRKVQKIDIDRGTPQERIDDQIQRDVITEIGRMAALTTPWPDLELKPVHCGFVFTGDVDGYICTRAPHSTDNPGEHIAYGRDDHVYAEYTEPEQLEPATPVKPSPRPRTKRKTAEGAA